MNIESSFNFVEFDFFCHPLLRSKSYSLFITGKLQQNVPNAH